MVCHDRCDKLSKGWWDDDGKGSDILDEFEREIFELENKLDLLL